MFGSFQKIVWESEAFVSEGVETQFDAFVFFFCARN